jgi:hypothetical protein
MRVGRENYAAKVRETGREKQRERERKREESPLRGN